MTSIFSFIGSQILGNVGQITKQADAITSGVADPLKAILNEVSGGSWKGDGATRFTTEMTTDVLPMLAQLFIVNTSFASGFQKSHDHMQNAIKQASAAAQTLNDVFSSIF